MAIVGDVHGDATRLRRLLTSRELQRRRIVLVGDYVNRGPESATVLEILSRLKGVLGDDLILISGNHEAALLSYLRDGDLPSFARFGGMATIRSYVHVAMGDVQAQFASALPDSHRRLLTESLQTYLETDDLLVSHVGYDPQNPADRSETAMTHSTHEALFDPDTVTRTSPRQLVVCGHYVQRSGLPYDIDGFVCLDSGCGTTGGPLTALLLPERTFISV